MIRMYGFMMLAEFGKPRASGDDPMGRTFLCGEECGGAWATGGAVACAAYVAGGWRR